MNKKEDLIRELREQVEVLTTIAIPREKEAYEFYVKMANKSSAKTTKSFFVDLARQEINHQNQLASLKEKLLSDLEGLKKQA